MSIFSDLTEECKTGRHQECKCISEDVCECGCHKPIYWFKDPKTGAYFGLYGEGPEVECSGIQI